MNHLIEHVLYELAYEGSNGSSLDSMKEFIKQACEKHYNRFFHITYNQSFFYYFFETVILTLKNDLIQYYHRNDSNKIYSLSSLPKNVKEIEIFCNNHSVSFVINQDTRYRLFLGSDKINCNWNPITLQILEIIIQSRHDGIATLNISKILNLDFKSSFHHCKRLIHMNLTVKTSLKIKNDNHIKHFYIDFAPDNLQTYHPAQTPRIQLKQEILKSIRNSPAQIVIKTDLQELLDIKSDTQKYQLRIALQSLLYQGCIEQVIAKQNDKQVNCYRYIKELADQDDDDEYDGCNILQLQIPISLQIIKSIKDSENNGLTSTQIIKNFNLNRKFSETLLEDISVFPSSNDRKSRFPVKKQVKYIGKERSLVFYSNKQTCNLEQLQDRKESHTKLERSNMLLDLVSKSRGIIEMNTDTILKIQALVDEHEIKHSKEYHTIDKKTILRMAQYLESIKKIRIIQLSIPYLDSKFLDIKETCEQRTFLVNDPEILSFKSNDDSELVNHPVIQKYISDKQNTKRNIPIIDQDVESLVKKNDNNEKIESNKTWESRRKYGFITAKVSRIRIIHLFLVRLASKSGNNIIELTMNTLQSITIHEYFECFGQHYQSDIIDSFLLSISSHNTRILDLPEGLKIQIFHRNNTKYAFKLRFIQYLSAISKLGLIKKISANTILVLNELDPSGSLYSLLPEHRSIVDPILFWILIENKFAILPGLFISENDKDGDENLETLIRYKFQWTLNPQAPFYYHYQWMTICMEWISSNKLSNMNPFDSILLSCLVNISETYQVSLYKVVEFWQWNQETLQNQCSIKLKGEKKTTLNLCQETLEWIVLWCYLRYIHPTHYIADILFTLELEKRRIDNISSILNMVHTVIPSERVMADPLFPALFSSMDDIVFGNSKTPDARKYRLKNTDKDLIVKHVMEKLESYIAYEDPIDDTESSISNRTSNRVMKTMTKMLRNENNINARSRLFGTTLTEALSLATSTGSSIRRGVILYEKDIRTTIHGRWSEYHYLDCSMKWDPKDDVIFAVLCLKRLLWIEYKKESADKKLYRDWEQLFSQNIWNEAISYLRHINAIKYCEKHENILFQGCYLSLSDKFIQDLGELESDREIPNHIGKETCISRKTMNRIFHGLVHGTLELDDNLGILHKMNTGIQSIAENHDIYDSCLTSAILKILDKSMTIWDIKEQVMINYQDSDIDKKIFAAIHILEKSEIERIGAFSYKPISEHINFRLWSAGEFNNDDLEICLSSIESFIQIHPGCTWSELYTRKRTLFTSLELIELIEILIQRGNIIKKNFRLSDGKITLLDSCNMIDPMIMTCYWSG